MAKKRLLSGVRATGRPHVGNYFGAMKQFVDLQDEYESYIFIADYHSLIDIRDPEILREYILGVALDYLAIGLDPENVVLFQQSRLQEHTELAWIFDTLMPFAELKRGHAYKDAIANNKPVSAGVFNYPVLMAADILIYDPDQVPVGKDQQQHVEIAQMLAKKFNKAYGDTFRIPKPRIMESVATVPGIDGKKMSKSNGNGIEIFDPTDVIRKKVMSIQTDSTPVGQPIDPEKDVTFALHELFSADMLPELEKRYTSGDIGYKESKELLFENIEAYLSPLREKRQEIEKDLSSVHNILNEGAEKAGAIAHEKLEIVREKIGIRLK